MIDFTKAGELPKYAQCVTILFSEELDRDAFWEWVEEIWQDDERQFHLWGHPITLGPTKVHVYGLETLSWTTAYAAFTSRSLVLCFLGTRMEVAKQLITKLVENIDPQARVWIGDKEITGGQHV
jgi:hypothetical protein